MLSRGFSAFLTGVLTLSVGLPETPSATLLYASSYHGTVATLNLTVSSVVKDGGDFSRATAQQATLEVVATTRDCSPDPSWLTLDFPNSRLYCVGEGLTTPNGSLTSFRTFQDGSLERLNKVDTIGGPVSSIIYGAEGDHKGLAIAH